MMKLAGTGHRAGVVRINGRSVWALSVFEYIGDDAASARGKRVRVRINLDDCEHLGLCDYRQVQVKLGRLAERMLYLRARLRVPPFCWLEFGSLLGW